MKDKLAQIWNNFVTSGWGSKQNPRTYTRLVFLNVSTLIGLLVLTYYFFRDLAQGSNQIYVELVIGLIFILAVLLTRFTRNINLASFIILFSTFINYLFLILSGGSNNAGLYWFAIFPVSAFFLYGRKKGLLWSVAFLILSWVIVHLGNSGAIKIAFSYEIASQALVAVGVVTVLMYFYESITENYEALLKKQKDDLLSVNQKLELEVEERRKAEEILAESTRQIEEKNQFLEASKTAMLNVFEDEKELEEQLKREKASVEKKIQERTIELRKEKEELAHANQIIEASVTELEKEKSRLVASINSLSLGFVMTDNDNFIVAINHSAKEILGLRKQIIKTEELEEKLAGSFSVLAASREVRKNKIPVEFNHVNFGKKILRIFVSPIITLANTEEYIGTVLLFEDITERTAIERSKDEFFSIASHELRTPLAAIRSYTALLKQLYSSKLKEKKFDEMTDDIHDSSLRLIQIVNDFLDTSKLEQGKITFNKEKIKVREVITEVVKDMDSLVKQGNIYLKVSGGESVLIHADKERLKQILVNLIGNSIKFTKKGGITISISKTKELAKIQVKDTGKGIDLKNQSLLFRKFQQAEDSILTRDSNRATGLGLYISKLLVEGMGGSIQLKESSLGKGAIFEFSLPLSKK